MPPVSSLLKKAAGLAKGSGEPNRNKVGKITQKQAEDVAKAKLPGPQHEGPRRRRRDGQGHRPLDGHRGNEVIDDDRAHKARKCRFLSIR